MTVGELIGQLSEYDKNLPVIISEWDAGDNVYRFVHVKIAQKTYIGSKTPGVSDQKVVYIHGGMWFEPEEL